MPAHRARRLAVSGVGTLSLALAAGGVLAPAASADTCTATEQGAVCGPGELSPPGVNGPDQAGASAAPRAAATSAELGGEADYRRLGDADPASTRLIAESAAFDRNPDGSIERNFGAVDSPGGPASAEVDAGASRATSVADGSGSSAASSAVLSSTAESNANGPRASAASAAFDTSQASARSDDGATSAAGASNHSTATARATGTGSIARAAASDHDEAYAMATKGGIADVSRTNAHCRGGFTYGFEKRSPSLCTSFGPVGIGFSAVTGPDIGLAGIDLGHYPPGGDTGQPPTGDKGHPAAGGKGRHRA